MMLDFSRRWGDPDNCAFPLIGENIRLSHEALHEQWHNKEADRIGVAKIYGREDFILIHNRIVRILSELKLVHEYKDDLDHTLPYDLKFGSEGYSGEILQELVYESGMVVSEMSLKEAKALLDSIPVSPKVDQKRLDEIATLIPVPIRALAEGMSLNRRLYSSQVLNEFLDDMPMPGFLGHEHAKPSLPFDPKPYIQPAASHVGAVIHEGQMFVKAYAWNESGKPLLELVEHSIAIGRSVPVSISASMEVKMKSDGEGQYLEVLHIKKGSATIDFYPPSVEPGVPGAGTVNLN